MSTDNSIFLAVDTSYEQGVIVLFRGDEVLFEQRLEHKFAHGKLVCQAIGYAMAVHHDIDGVLCGLGPGSFVGVRVALATMLGFCFGRTLPLMGFCSHDALAYATKHTNDFSLFMRASGDLGYFTSYQVFGDESCKIAPTRVVHAHDVAVHLGNNETMFTDYQWSVAPIDETKHRIERITGPSPRAVAYAARMRIHAGIVDESTFIKPNYVKEPSVSLPKAR